MVEESITNPTPQVKPSGVRRLVVTLAAVAILVLAFGVVWMQSSKYEPLVVGMNAPDFNLPDIQGKSQRLSDYRGKVIFLNFWATWCKPCKEEMPSMQTLWENLKQEDFVMLAISMDRVTTKKDIPPFVENMKLTFPILTDSWGQTDNRYKLMGVPETYIIDQSGVLREKVIGPRDWTRTESITTIVQLLQKQRKSVRAD
ncbi:MAG: TlpA family protein disulfide reductase [Nitrospirae bacterium]|nr:MAG: TlpA family protein disulfide reductase [Nitrospirota bacterium]